MKTCFVIVVGLFTISSVISMGVAADKKMIRVNGAAMSAQQVLTWSNEFIQRNPDYSITVTGSSAGKGFLSLFEDNTEVALASRGITAGEKRAANEKGITLEERQIGHSAIAIITSKANPIAELTLDQIRNIFTGRTTNWKELGGPDIPIRAFSRRIPESGGAVFFWEHVLEKEPLGSKVTIAESFSSIIKVCAVANDNPIGIAPAGNVKDDVKIIGVKIDNSSAAVLPTAENIASRAYPIILKFSMWWNVQNKDDRLMKYVDYCEARGHGKKP